MLDKAEYVEQAYFFRVLGERLRENIPMQELLVAVREEVLATTKLPLAIGFLASELNHSGIFGPAMSRLDHYFTSFQSYVVSEAENERGRFDLRIALSILEKHADYMTSTPMAEGVFMYQLETLCRNRLRYDKGLRSMENDPIFDQKWRNWLRTVRSQIGLVDLADMIYVRSKYYWQRSSRYSKNETMYGEKPPLFGEREGKIALANRRKDPLLLFAALQRHLGYPEVPRPQAVDETPELVPQMMRRLERLEARMKLMEEENQGGIDLSQFYQNGRGSSAG